MKYHFWKVHDYVSISTGDTTQYSLQSSPQVQSDVNDIPYFNTVFLERDKLPKALGPVSFQTPHRMERYINRKCWLLLCN